ncbi:MAG TPA: hypothetical protein VFY18_03255 [Candidatus Limnocylindrales bacterium]|nr:hypothetical protein [Candidatus Limnocylindrales bacterium]
MITRLVIAAFLLAHGAIHFGFVSPRPPATADGPPWPFQLGRSWVLGPLGVDADLARVLGTALIAVTLGGFALAAVAALGVAPAGIWPAAVAVGAIGSVAVLSLFFHPWLVLGLAIDVTLLWAVFVASWAPEGMTP